MLLLTKSKGHKSNSSSSGFPNHLQTKSNLHNSIRQSHILCIKSRWGPCMYYIKSSHEIMTHNINGLIQINAGVVHILVQRTREFEPDNLLILVFSEKKNKRPRLKLPNLL